MNKKKLLIGLITYHKLRDLNDDDQLLAAELIQKGFEVKIADWEDEKVVWTEFDIVIIRSVWNYHLKHAKFINWLSKIDSDGVEIWNNPQMIKWNSDKKYLDEISKSFTSIDSIYISKIQKDLDLMALKQKDWDQIIIKPVISASAFNTVKTTVSQLLAKPTIISENLDHSDLVIQPFIKEIQTIGEWSVIYFNGKFSHSVLKKPKVGDYRTQPELGGSALIERCSDDIIKTGRDIISYISNKFEIPILYARIDGIELNGKFILMEIELIEPFLYFGIDDKATSRLVDALTEIYTK